MTHSINFHNYMKELKKLGFNRDCTRDLYWFILYHRELSSVPNPKKLIFHCKSPLYNQLIKRHHLMKNPSIPIFPKDETYLVAWKFTSKLKYPYNAVKNVIAQALVLQDHSILQKSMTAFEFQFWQSFVARVGTVVLVNAKNGQVVWDLWRWVVDTWV